MTETELSTLPLNNIIQGDCIQAMNRLPANSIDLIFADPPYNLQLRGELWRPNMTLVDAVDDAWDRFDDFRAYDTFTRDWLSAARRVLKDTGTLWVIGSYHNIYRVGAILMDLGFWFLNDVVWVKTNPMPQMRGVRFANAHETLLWAKKSDSGRYTFNYHAMKALNGGKQMRSDWLIPICSGTERIKVDGKKAHSTQKPEALLRRVLLSSSNPGDVVLDPFFGTGTTGAVARKLHRQWIGIERDPFYVDVATRRIDAIQPEPLDTMAVDRDELRRSGKRIAFSRLLAMGVLTPGQTLYFRRDRGQTAQVQANGDLLCSTPDSQDAFQGSIHAAGRFMQGGSPCNGWEHWYFEDEQGELQLIDLLREQVRASELQTEDQPGENSDAEQS